jgi:tetratricopeptide (TPR) repeat protein
MSARAESQVTTRRFAVPFPLLAALLAFALRALYLLESADNPFRQHLTLDPRVYDLWARGILGGVIFSPDAFPQAPLYPYVLAAVYTLLGAHPERMLWVQTLLAAATTGLGAHAAGRLWGRTAGVAAGVLLACYQPGIFYTGILLVPILATFLLALALALAARPLLAGLAVGLAGLAQPVLLPGALLATFGLRLRERSRRGWLADGYRLLAGVALVIAPVTLHNLVQGHAFVPIAANAGINAYIGNGPQANGFYAPPTGLVREGDIYGIAQASQLSGRELHAAEASRFWTTRTLEAMRARPGRTSTLALRKLIYFLQAYEAPQVESLDFEKRYSWMLRLPILPTWIVLLALAAVAFPRLRRDRAYNALLAAVGLTALVSAAFFVTGRFRFPVHLYLGLAAGAGLPVLMEAIGGETHAAGARAPRRGARLARALLPALLVVLLFSPGWLPGSRPRAFGEFHYRLGQLAEMDDREPEARREYEEALRQAPGHFQAAIRLGTLEARANELDRALAHLTQGVQLDPDNAPGLLTLGQAYQVRADLAAACSLYARAWAADTTRLATLEFFATASYLRGDVAAAETLASDLVRRAGRTAPLAQRCVFLLQRIAERRHFGWVLWSDPLRAEGDLAFAAGNLASAHDFYRRALESAPRDPVTLLELARIATLRGEDAAGWRARYMTAGGSPEALLIPARSRPVRAPR